MTDTPPALIRLRDVDRTLLLAGAVHLAALFAPVARVRLYGRIPFVRIPMVGPTLIVLGVLTLAVAAWPRGWWRWAPSGLTAAVLAVLYWRLARAPLGSFIDPVIRWAVHPSWGFVPMAVAVLIGLIGATRVRPAH